MLVGKPAWQPLLNGVCILLGVHSCTANTTDIVVSSMALTMRLASFGLAERNGLSLADLEDQEERLLAIRHQREEQSLYPPSS